MSVTCSNCRTENADGMRFCTNCGTALDDATLVSRQNTVPTSLNLTPNPPPAVKTGGINRNMAIFGGLGCLLLFVVGVVALVGIIYLSSGNDNSNVAQNDNAKNSNTNIVLNNNRNSTNTTGNIKFPTSNTNTASNTDNSNTDSAPDEIPVELPQTIGTYEQTATNTVNAVDEFPGAVEVNKSSYAKGSRKADVVFAKFASPTAAKDGFEYFLGGQKSSGAKVLVRQKIKNKSGVVNGEAAVYKSRTMYEILIYADKYGFRIASKDRVALQDFATQFGKAVQGIEGLE